jgi:hypothetical protein
MSQLDAVGALAYRLIQFELIHTLRFNPDT